MPGHTHSLDTFWEGTVRKVQFSHITLTYWTHFESALSANPLWQKMPHHTHFLDTFWESTVSKVQLGRKCQVTLTYWTHFESQQSPVWQAMPCHTHILDTFWESTVFQEMPGHTHSLDTFWKGTVRQSSLAGNSRSHSQPGHILRGHCQPVLFGKKYHITLTYWTHCTVS